MKVEIDDALRFLPKRIRELEASMARLDATDPEEIESEEYEAILDTLVKAREEYEAVLKRVKK